MAETLLLDLSLLFIVHCLWVVLYIVSGKLSLCQLKPLKTYKNPKDLFFLFKKLSCFSSPGLRSLCARSIYVDAVINHMTGGGSGVGSDNSSFDGEAQSYPGVPYSSGDFHGHAECPTRDLNIWVRV